MADGVMRVWAAKGGWRVRERIFKTLGTLILQILLPRRTHLFPFHLPASLNETPEITINPFPCLLSFMPTHCSIVFHDPPTNSFTSVSSAHPPPAMPWSHEEGSKSIKVRRWGKNAKSIYGLDGQAQRREMIGSEIPTALPPLPLPTTVTHSHPPSPTC